MDIPFGFQLDPQSGLYYKEEDGWEEEDDDDGWEDGTPIRIVTWLDPQSGATQQVNYPVEPPIAESEPDFEPPLEPPPLDEGAPDFELPSEPPPLDEGEQLLEPPPEPILAPTGLPMQNPYAAVPSQADHPPSSPMFADPTPTILQETDNRPGMPQPLPKKKSKLPVILLTVGVIVVLAAIGICGWQFGWFGGQSMPTGVPSSSATPSTSTPEEPVSSSTSTPDEPPSSSTSTPNEPPSSSTSTPNEPPSSSSDSTQADGSESEAPGSRVDKPELAENIGVKVDYQSATTADITLTNIVFKSSYPTQIPGVVEDPNQILYGWLAATNDYGFMFLYIREEVDEDKNITVSDMHAYALDQEESNSNGLIQIEHSVTDNSITFHNVTVPENRGIDFSNPDTVYEIEVLEGLNFGEKQVQAAVAKNGGSEPSDKTLATEYRYIDSDTDMQVVLTLYQDRNAFELDADLSGSTYHVSGGFALQTDGTLVLESADTSPAWQGVARFSIQADGGLRLESPQYLGVLPAGGVLVVASPKPAEKEETQTVKEEKFLYAGLFICADTRIPKDYRPTIQLNEDMSFTMNINTGEAIVTGTGTFVWDIQPQMLYLNFREIAGETYDNGSLMADVQILNEHKLQFLSDEFGLVGYDEQHGIFMKQ